MARLRCSAAKGVAIQTLEESADVVCFKVVYPDLTQTITVEDVVKNVDGIRVSFPMLVFDGKDRTQIDLKNNQLNLELNGKGVTFTVLDPAGLQLKRSGVELNHRNGMVEEVSAEASGKRMVYRISGE
ncbi:hypothetical protein P4B35_13975 [Pontiellaceae bacterium B12227]|nr:hypothetical protein [Pontiellaceae bacterium B12227]